MKSTLFFLIITFFSLTSSKRPIIGIYGVVFPHDDYSSFSEELVDGAMVRWLEDEGAKMLLIHHWYSHSQIDTLLSKINGVVFPGVRRKSNWKSLWEQNARYIVRKATEISLPIFGVCRGFQLVNVFTADDTSILGDCKNTGAHRMTLTPFAYESKLYSLFEKKDFYYYENTDTSALINSHGIDEETFRKNKNLNGLCDITSFSTDLTGKMFINSIESRKNSGKVIFGTQFHPEMALYTRHDELKFKPCGESLKRSQMMALSFVKECSMNKNKMSEDDMNKYQFINTFKLEEGVRYNHTENKFYFKKGNLK